MNSDEKFCFPFESSSSGTPSINFPAQSSVRTSQYGNIMNSSSSSGLFDHGFTSASDSTQGQCPILSMDPMQLSNNAVSQPQLKGFGSTFNHNFSSNFEYSHLQHDLHNSTPLGLHNSLLNCSELQPSSLPVGNSEVLTGDSIMQNPETSRPTGGHGVGGNMQVPCRRNKYKKKPNAIFPERRSSMYRGVSRYTGRYEAFLWDNTNPAVKGRTVYIGGFETEEEAAKAYDLAALKFWGPSAPLNFPINQYEKELLAMQMVTKEEFLLKIKRKSKGFAKGASSYRGVSRNSDGKKWQARLGKGKGLKGLYLGTFQTEVAAARAYDVAVLRMKGLNAITNFDLNHYDIRYILESRKLPIGKGASKRLKRNLVEDVIQMNKKTCNDDKFPLLQLQVPDITTNITSSSQQYDHDAHQIIVIDSNHDDQPNPKDCQALIAPSIEDLSDVNNKTQIKESFFHDQNPSSFDLFDFSPHEMICSTVDPTSELSSIGGVSVKRINGIENLEMEDLQFFDQNPSCFQSLYHDSQSPNKDDQLKKNSSFRNLFTSDAGSRSSQGNANELGSAGNLAMVDAANHDADDSTDNFWSEIHAIDLSEFHDFHDFFSHDNKNDANNYIENLLQNPSFLDSRLNGSSTQGGLEK